MRAFVRVSRQPSAIRIQTQSWTNSAGKSLKGYLTTVFVKENGAWKLAGMFSTTLPQILSSEADLRILCRVLRSVACSIRRLAVAISAGEPLSRHSSAI
jgi:hypothetical protein